MEIKQIVRRRHQFIESNTNNALLLWDPQVWCNGRDELQLLRQNEVVAGHNQFALIQKQTMTIGNMDVN